MWQIDNRTPFAADRSWVRGRDGTEISLIAIKATFDIQADGHTTIAPEQPPPLLLAEYHGEPGKSSLKYEADFVLNKATTDVIVVGSAHAPGGRPVEQLDVGFRVGPIRRVLRVFGDRYWGSFGASAPVPFASMPIVYERAFGGPDVAENPIGTDEPTILDPDDPKRPAGFGPLAPTWPARRKLLGALRRALDNAEIPPGFDSSYFQSAPADQRVDFLRGDERILLEGLHPSLPRL